MGVKDSVRMNSSISIFSCEVMDTLRVMQCRSKLCFALTGILKLNNNESVNDLLPYCIFIAYLYSFRSYELGRINMK
jgi:hypothetical protein